MIATATIQKRTTKGETRWIVRVGDEAMLVTASEQAAKDAVEIAGGFVRFFRNATTGFRPTTLDMVAFDAAIQFVDAQRDVARELDRLARRAADDAAHAARGGYIHRGGYVGRGDDVDTATVRLEERRRQFDAIRAWIRQSPSAAPESMVALSICRFFRGAA